MDTVRPLVYGLTGGIACGKSTFARHLASLGATVIDADLVARDVVAPGTPGNAAVRARFGEAIALADGSIDRARLGALVFSDSEARAGLNAIVHPLVRERSMALIADALANGRTPVFYEAALLFETGADAMFPEVVVVGCTEASQLQRLMERDGLTHKDATARIASQMPLSEKRARAALYVDNSGTPEALREAAMEVLRWARPEQSGS